jgi:hypothetical protein
MTSRRQASARVDDVTATAKILSHSAAQEQLLLGLTKIERTLRGFIEAGCNLTH